ncbi:MAG: hypothetical protein ACJ798_02505 [Phenylobacterium sp.]
MTFPVDPPHRPPLVRRSGKAEADRSDPGPATEAANLPVPVEKAAAQAPRAGSVRPGGDAAINAQVIGEKRGLRAGPAIHDQAKASYNQTEWSGSKDRRAPKGRGVKTEI